MSTKLQSHIQPFAQFILSKISSPKDFNSAYIMSLIALEYFKINKLNRFSPQNKLNLSVEATHLAELTLAKA